MGCMALTGILCRLFLSSFVMSLTISLSCLNFRHKLLTVKCGITGEQNEIYLLMFVNTEGERLISGMTEEGCTLLQNYWKQPM